MPKGVYDREKARQARLERIWGKRADAEQDQPGGGEATASLVEGTPPSAVEDHHEDAGERLADPPDGSGHLIQSNGRPPLIRRVRIKNGVETVLVGKK